MAMSDAIPTNVYVSAFYMDTNLVSYSHGSGSIGMGHKQRIWF